ncbi:MAG: hypothetical protein ACYTG7_26040 [Planctomycetota bacterium]|jgi:hypothetical protein
MSDSLDKEDAIREGIKEQTQILRSLKSDKKKGHKVDYLIDQTEGQLIALKRMIPRGHLLTFLPFLVLNAGLGAFLFSGHFAPFVRKFLEGGFAGKALAALVGMEHHAFYAAGTLAILVIVVFLVQRKARTKHAAIGNVAAVILEIAAITAIAAPWNFIPELFAR